MDHLVKLTVVGVDAAKFLQGYLTCDLDNLKSSSAIPMALTDIKGRVVANGWCYGLTSQVTLVIHHSLINPVKTHLGKYMTFAKSKFADELELLSLTTTAGEYEIELTPFGWGLVPAEQTETNLSQLTIAQAFPIIQERTSGLFLPQMLSLTQHGAVSFTKGCYLGQEIVARTEHRGQVKRQLFRTKRPKQKVSVGETINVDGRGACTVVGVNQDQLLLVGRAQKTV